MRSTPPTEGEDRHLRRLASRLARHAPRWLVDAEDLYQVGALAVLEGRWPRSAMIDELRRFGRSRTRPQVLTLLHDGRSQDDERGHNTITPDTLAALRETLAALSPREQVVVTAILGTHSQRECMALTGWSEGRISQVRAKITRALRACMIR